MGLVTLLPMFGVALFLRRRVQLKAAESLLHAVSLIVLISYVAAISGVLWWWTLALHVGGVSLLGLELLQRVRSNPRAAVPVPYGLMIILALSFWLVHGGDHYLYYDEYAHWGIFLKDMLSLDGFWPANTNAMHVRYPPAAPLWEYLFSAFLTPSEGKAYLAQFVLLMTPLLVLWESIKWRQFQWIIGILALCALVLTDFGLGVTSLYVDHVLAAWFAGTVLSYVSYRNRSLSSVLLFALPLATIALIKDAGLAFALAGGAIIGLLIFRQEWSLRGPWSGLVRSGGMFLALVAPALVCVYVWSWNRDLAGSPKDVKSVDGIVSGIAAGAASVDPATVAEIKRRFRDVFMHQQLSNDEVSLQFNEFSYGIRDLFMQHFRLTTASLFIIVVVWWIVLVSLVLFGEARWTWGIVAVGVLATALGFVVALYFSYSFAFEGRGLELPSYIRYVQTVALPLVLISYAPLLPGFREEPFANAWRMFGRTVSRHASLFVTATVALYVVETPYLRPLFHSNSPIPVRQVFEPIATAIHRAVGKSSIWIYLPQDQPNGFIGHLLQFLLAPTPAKVERSPEFFQRAPSAIRSSWMETDYIWIPVLLSPDAAAHWRQFAPNAPAAGLFRVRLRADSDDFEIEPISGD